MATLALAAPANAAQPQLTVNSFTYLSSDAAGKTMVVRVNYVGSTPSASLTFFGIQLAAAAVGTNIFAISNGKVSTTACKPGSSGANCTFVAGFVPSGGSFALVLATQTIYPAGSTNSWSAGDTGGATNLGTFMGPADPGPACPTISMAPPTLPGGTQGTPYQQSVSASGGTGPYDYLLWDGNLPSGVSLGDDGSIAGTPTVGGNFPFEVLAFDQDNCAGTGSYTLPIQLHAPQKCVCAGLSVKVDPTLINKKKLRPDKHSFGIGFDWTMTCTSGSGQCKAVAQFQPPEVIAGSVPVFKNNFKLNVHTVTFVCLTPCGKSSKGRFEVKLKSRRQLNRLFGKTLSFTVLVTCSNKSARQVVNVFVDKHGRLHRRH
jgi:hypothetical protein